MQRIRDYFHEQLIRYWLRRTKAAMRVKDMAEARRCDAVTRALLLARSKSQIARMERRLGLPG